MNKNNQRARRDKDRRAIVARSRRGGIYATRLIFSRLEKVARNHLAAVIVSRRSDSAAATFTFGDGGRFDSIPFHSIPFRDTIARFYPVDLISHAALSSRPGKRNKPLLIIQRARLRDRLLPSSSSAFVPRQLRNTPTKGSFLEFP